MSWLQKLHQAGAELAQRSADPWRQKLEVGIGGMEAVSTAALLDLLHVPATTSTARRLAQNMRGLGYVPIKSRRLMPGGLRGTVTRGWARPVRRLTSQVSLPEGEKAGSFHPDTTHHATDGYVS
jgi:hypothetical protein